MENFLVKILIFETTHFSKSFYDEMVDLAFVLDYFSQETHNPPF